MKHSQLIMTAVIAGASLVTLFHWITGVDMAWSWTAICVSTVIAEMIFGG